MKEIFKRSLSLSLVACTVLSLSAFKHNDVKEEVNSLSKKRVEIVSDKENNVEPSEVRTIYIPIIETLEKMKEYGYNYKEHFTEDEIKEFKRKDAVNKIKYPRYETRAIRDINPYYTRVFINKSVVKAVIGFTGSLATAASIITTAIPPLAPVAIYIVYSIMDVYTSIQGSEVYSHVVDTPYKIESVITKPINFSGWVHHDIIRYDDENPALNRTVATKWYYISNEYLFVPYGDESNWKVINGKWYEFNDYGILLEHEGWIKYNGKWMYHIPGDFGAYRNTGQYIDGTWYEFDSDGYMK